MASIALQDEGGDVWKGWKRIGVTPPSRGWYWKSTRGGNLNHYKHESNGKYLVSTWGELNLSELRILDSERNGVELLKQMHVPQKRKAIKQKPYVGDEDGHTVISNPADISRIQQTMEEQHLKTLKVVANEEKRINANYLDAKRSMEAQKNKMLDQRNKFLNQLVKDEKKYAGSIRNWENVLNNKIEGITKVMYGLKKDVDDKMKTIERLTQELNGVKTEAVSDMTQMLNNLTLKIAEEKKKRPKINIPKLEKAQIPELLPTTYAITNNYAFKRILSERLNLEVMNGLKQVATPLQSLNEIGKRIKKITLRFASMSLNIKNMYNNTFLCQGTYKLDDLPKEIRRPCIVTKDNRIIETTDDKELNRLKRNNCEPGVSIICIDESKDFTIAYKATRGGDAENSNIVVTLEFFRKEWAPLPSCTGWV